MKTKILLVSALLALVISAGADTAPVTLAWDRNPEPDVDRYEVQIGTATGVYDHLYQVIDGSVQLTVQLETGVIYFAVVSALNTSDLKSAPSKELAFQVYKPGQGKPPAAPSGVHKTNILVSLQSSPDLRVWSEQLFLVAAEKMFWRLQVSR